MTKKYTTKQTIIDEQAQQVEDLSQQVKDLEILRNKCRKTPLTGLRRKPEKFQTWCLLKQRSRYGKITTDRTRQ
jgi:cell division protein FtsL